MTPGDRIRTFQSERHRRKIGTAIEVVKREDGTPGPGLRHWTPHIRSSIDQIGDAQLSHTACDVSVAGMVLTPGTWDDINCDDCRVIYVANYLQHEDDDDLERER